MSEPFEIWAPKQIAHHRSEAATLERALAAFLASNAAGQGAAATPRKAPPATVAPIAAAQGNGGRPIKHRPVFDAMAKTLTAGLTPDEIFVVAQAAGTPMSRDNLRSFIWTNKKSGKFVAKPNGRLVLARFAEAEAGDPKSSAQAETRGLAPLAPSQHTINNTRTASNGAEAGGT